MTIANKDVIVVVINNKSIKLLNVINDVVSSEVQATFKHRLLMLSSIEHEGLFIASAPACDALGRRIKFMCWLIGSSHASVSAQ